MRRRTTPKTVAKIRV